ncbi:MAG: peptidase S53 [Ktedonobacterales bacterium]|nr:peptidase S53 [Ktedonobacterales bacterium]
MHHWYNRLTIVVMSLLAIAAGMSTSVSAAYAAVTPPNRHTLSGHIIPALAQARPIGRTDASQKLSLSIALNLNNAAGLNALLAAQNDPQSHEYHHYLTPQTFAAEFGPSKATVLAVVNYLQSQGLQVNSIAPNHLLLDATGSAAQVQRAFAVQLANYRLAGRTVYAPTNEPSVPLALQGAIRAIGGLDDVAHYQPALTRAISGHGSGPNGGYTPSELRAAYDLNPLISSANGAGQTVGIFELDGYVPTDINTYLSKYGLGAANYSNVLVDGATNTAGSGAIEAELDMEIVSAIAPGAAQKIYIGPNSLQGINDTYTKIVTDNVAKVVSISWGACEAAMGTSELGALDTIFKQGAAQGQTFFAAAGDAGAYDCNTTGLGVDSPADDPYVVGVGGTNLQTNSGGSYASEATWSCATCTQGRPKGAGAGGGLSSYFAQPSYQSGPGVTNGYANGKRAVPDVAADADPNSGYSVYCTASASGCVTGTFAWTVVGGTSAAAPLWAALAADTNGYLTASKKAVLGNANAALYRLFNTAQPFAAFHDVTAGNNLYYPATAGYDMASGIGTPDAWNLARDAAGLPAVANDFGLSSAPTSLTIGQGSTGTAAVTTTLISGTVGTIALTASVSTGATLPTATLAPPSVAPGGSTTLTVAVGAAVPAGTYTVAVTGTAGSLTHSTTLTVTVTAIATTPITTQLLGNPGFENGQVPWQQASSGGFQLIDPLNVHSGSYSAWLCGYANCTDQIQQTVTLPTTTTKAILSFWLYNDITRANRTCISGFTVLLRNSAGQTLATLKSQCAANTGWLQYTADVTSLLSSYKGQAMQIAFQATTTATQSTNFFVDDVAFNVTH